MMRGRDTHQSNASRNQMVSEWPKLFIGIDWMEGMSLWHYIDFSVLYTNFANQLMNALMLAPSAQTAKIIA